MKTKVFRSFCSVVFATVLAMTSCRDQDFVFEEHYPGEEIKKEYEQNWVKQMGAIDPEQDWCMVEQQKIFVDVPEERAVSIYALNNDGDYQLVNKYFCTLGKQLLSVDVRKGTEKLLVSDGKVTIETKVGEEVSFAEIRATRASSDWNVTASTNIDLKKTLTQSDLSAIKGSFEGWADSYDNKKNSTPNYQFEVANSASNKVVVYPLFWESSDFDKIIGYPLLDVAHLFPKTEKTKYIDEVGFYYMSGSDLIMKPIFKNEEDGTLKYTKDGGTTWNPMPTGDKYKSSDNYISSGFEVELPSECHTFGIYIHNYYKDSYNDVNELYYSESILNDGYNNWLGVHIDHLIKCGVRTYKGDKYVVLGDKFGNSLGNVVLRIDGVRTLNNTPESWYVACEDLGDTGDYDFNDLVFKFQKHVGGTNTDPVYELRVTPLAAGGTLSARYGVDTNDIGEIHAKFTKNGASLGSPDNFGKYTMINTNAEGGVDGGTAQTEVFTYTNDFSLYDEIQKFWVKVDKDPVKSSLEVNNPTPDYELGDNGRYVITAPKKGKAPQMIVVPEGWNWPKERVSILDAYPEFSTWSSDASKDDWDLAKAKDGNGDICPFYYQPSTSSSGN